MAACCTSLSASVLPTAISCQLEPITRTRLPWYDQWTVLRGQFLRGGKSDLRLAAASQKKKNRNDLFSGNTPGNKATKTNNFSRQSPGIVTLRTDLRYVDSSASQSCYPTRVAVTCSQPYRTNQNCYLPIGILTCKRH